MTDVQTEHDEQEIEDLVLTELMSLNAIATGIIAGLMGGLGIWVATIFLVIKGGGVVGPHLALLNQYFIGYHVSFGGSFIGFGYGFVTCFLLGFAVAAMYNRLVDLKVQRITRRLEAESRARLAAIKASQPDTDVAGRSEGSGRKVPATRGGVASS